MRYRGSDATGALQVLECSSVFAIALGAQRRVRDLCYARAGYTCNQSPIRNSESFYNIASALIYDPMLSVGGSYQLNDKLAGNVAYSHYFENDRVRPIVRPTGAISGSSITDTLTADFLSLGVVIRQ